MVRITLADNSVQELEYMIDASNTFYLIPDGLIAKYKIAKIEKQAKDLTLVEMAKLGIDIKYTDSTFTKLDCAIDIYTLDRFELDEYIDITDLLRE